MKPGELRAYIDRSRYEYERLAAEGDEDAQRLVERLREIDRSYYEGLAAINSACDAGLRRIDREYYLSIALMWACLLGLWVACVALLTWLAQPSPFTQAELDAAYRSIGGDPVACPVKMP